MQMVNKLSAARHDTVTEVRKIDADPRDADWRESIILQGHAASGLTARGERGLIPGLKPMGSHPVGYRLGNPTKSSSKSLCISFPISVSGSVLVGCRCLLSTPTRCCFCLSSDTR